LHGFRIPIFAGSSRALRTSASPPKPLRSCPSAQRSAAAATTSPLLDAISKAAATASKAAGLVPLVEAEHGPDRARGPRWIRPVVAGELLQDRLELRAGPLPVTPARDDRAEDHRPRDNSVKTQRRGTKEASLEELSVLVEVAQSLIVPRGVGKADKENSGRVLTGCPCRSPGLVAGSRASAASAKP
jgi:hypothetical protein